MSHIDQGPLASYNSLADNNLSGFFTNTRMRRHLRKAGLVTKHGEIVTENTYRLNMSRKEHKQHVKDMLAQAIVHKTLDLERNRQAEIRKKLEEIAKIELVRRVRSARQSKRESDILPYISPRSSSSRPTSGPEPHPPTRQGRKRSGPKRTQSGTSTKSSRPASSQPSSYRKRRPVSALSSNYDEDGEGDVVYLDDEGTPIAPAHVDESQLRYSSKDPIDTRHLYSLDSAALRRYTMLMAKMEQGRAGTSPYLVPQVPLPPKSPRSSRAASARRTPRSAQRYRSESGKSASPKRPSTANQTYLHPTPGGQRFKGQQESLCQVAMVYHGSSLSLSRELLPGKSKQDVVVEQQHCGGNTLTVFRDALEKGSKFSFISYRHRGYPFSLSIYIDGKMDCRVSTCCEYRHQKGGKIGGKKGHFSISGIEGAVPCYKCQVEKGIRVGNQAPKPKLKRPPEQQEEVVVVETARKSESPKPEPQAAPTSKKEQILVPVEDADKADEKYDEDFESSSSESEEEAPRFEPKEARGVDKTTGKVDINELTSDEEQEGIGPQLFSKPPKRKKNKTKRRNEKKKSGDSSSSSSGSSSGSSSSSEDEPTARGQAQAKVITIRAENIKAGQTDAPKATTAAPDADRKSTKVDNSEHFREDGKGEVKHVNIKTDEKREETDNDKITHEDKKKRRGSSSSSSSSSSRGSTKDYSDSEKEDERKEGEKKKSGDEEEREKKVEKITAPVVSMSDNEQDRKNNEEEEVKVKGEIVGGVDESVKYSLPTVTAVQVEDVGKDEEADKEPTEAETSAVDNVAVEESSPKKRRDSGASTASSSSEATPSSSSGSASIRDKGPNTVNDPTAVMPPAPVYEKNRSEDDAERKNSYTIETVQTVESVEEKTIPTIAEPAEKQERKKSKGSGSEDSDSDSSSSGSDSDKDKKKKDEEKDDEDVLAVLAAKLAEEKKEADERQKIKDREVEEREKHRKKLEEERERRRKLAEENEIKTNVIPELTFSRQTSGGSDSESSSGSDSDEDNKKDKSSVIKTEADVHRKQSVASHDSENDEEKNTHEAPPLPDVRQGSVLPLLEKSRAMVEIKGVTLNESQLGEVAEHLMGQDRISQVNLVNCSLEDDDIQKVVQAMKRSPSEPVLLNLSLNPLTSECVMYLLDLISAKPSIEALLLQGTRLGDSGIELLVGGLLRNHNEKKYRKGDNHESIKELRELDLSDCKMGYYGAREVSSLIASDMEIDTLNLSSNQAISEDGWNLISEALAKNSTLETLTLDHNLLGDSGVKAIAKGLAANKSVTALDLNGVGITDAGGRHLLELLKQNTVLLEITMTENEQLSQAMVDSIGKYIALNKTVGGSHLQH